jgi:hypothetical protein
MKVAGRNSPITRTMYVSAPLQNEFAFYPYMTGRRLGGMYVNRDLRMDIDENPNLSVRDVRNQEHPDGQHR